MIQQTITGTAVRRAGAWSTGLASLDTLLNVPKQMFAWPGRISLSVTHGQLTVTIAERTRVVRPTEPDVYIPPIQYFHLDASDGAAFTFSWIQS